jgi:hypothetical protein
MGVNVTTQKLVWGIFAARCAICRNKVVWESGSGGRSLTGEIAHIVGAKLDAARGRAAISVDRDDPENLLLLCRDHHKIIDDNEDEYPTERLHQVRSEYLAWLEEQLTVAQPWSAGVISQYTYLNVPRLDEFAALCGYQIDHDLVGPGTHLSELGYNLNRLMGQYRRVLDKLPLEAHPANRIDFAHDGYIGKIISFERLRFRNKNVPLYRPVGLTTLFTGDLELDPHIYHKFANWRLVVNVDPQWITTSTAYTLVRSTGAGSLFSGFVRVSGIDLESNTMYATGLAIGLPTSPLDPLIHYEEVGKAVDMASFEDAVTKSRSGEWSGDVEACDECGKLFVEGDYMIDGPTVRGGPWGNICERCFLAGDRQLGIGKGQLYKRTESGWPLVGGYARPLDEE